MDFKKINFKQPRYALPLIALPFLLFFTFQFSKLMGQEKTKVVTEEEGFSLSLGESKDSILSKDAAYDNAFTKGDGRTMLDGLDRENDSLQNYADNLNLQQKTHIDSLRAVRSLQTGRGINAPRSYYNESSQRGNDQRDFERSADIIRMLNSQGNGAGYNTNSYAQTISGAGRNSTNNAKEDDPVTTLKKQMLVMDSLEKARDPEYQKALKAEQQLMQNREKMANFLNSTLRVNKATLNPNFNSISRHHEDSFIKAVIDEDIKGYLGSRIRFRLLEDVTIGKHKIGKGNFLFAQISGFEQQRVHLNIVSVLNRGEILPINLAVYDIDGIKGLYVPASMFREMMREMGTNSIQGTQLQSGEEGFFTSLASKLFSSTSRSIANILRQNKAKLKYNSYIYLINEQSLKNYENN